MFGIIFWDVGDKMVNLSSHFVSTQKDHIPIIIKEPSTSFVYKYLLYKVQLCVSSTDSNNKTLELPILLYVLFLGASNAAAFRSYPL